MDPDAQVTSENALLSEKSFMNDQLNPSIPNGFRLEWAAKKPRKKYKEAPEMVCNEQNRYFWIVYMRLVHENISRTVSLISWLLFKL